MQLVLDTKGLIVKKRNNCFHIINGKQSRLISPHKLTSIAVFQQCLLSTPVIILAAKYQIPILFIGKTGKVNSRLWSPNFGSISTIRRHQAYFALSGAATDWIIDLLKIKLEQQDHLLKKLGTRNWSKSEKREKMLTTFRKVEHYRGNRLGNCSEQIMGLEGSIAKIYWSMVSHYLPKPFQFAKRSRRPSLDAFNALLNYGYGMLYGVVEGATLATGLDPYLGFLHSDEYNKPTFTFDLIEAFRPWVDELIVQLILEQRIKTNYFTVKENTWLLSKKGKQFLIPAFNQWLHKKRKFGQKILSHKNQIHDFAGRFAQYLRHYKFTENATTGLL